MRNQQEKYTRVETLFRSGMTMREVAEKTGLSAEGVRKILARLGVSASEGGIAAKKQKKQARLEAERDEKYLSKYGCTYAEFKSVCGHHTEGMKSPFRAFTYQRNNAVDRGIEWDLKFWDWYQIWSESGKWEQRGKGANCYCMSRKGDEGPYRVGNVYIGKISENSRDGRTKAWESKETTAFYKVIAAAGGRKAVSQKLKLDRQYISFLGASGTMPAGWLENGKAEKLASMTVGAYSVEDLAKFVVRSQEKEAA